MTPNSLSFSSIEQTCCFLAAVQLHPFLLLCKQNILIARFSDSELFLAQEAYGAALVQTTETTHLIDRCFA